MESTDVVPEYKSLPIRPLISYDVNGDLWGVLD